MKETHKRSERWERLAFATLEEVADFLAAVTELVADAGAEPETVVSLSFADRDMNQLTIEELREVAPALDLNDAESVWAMTGTNLSPPVGATFSMRGGDGGLGFGPSTSVDVSGTNRTAVDGVNVQAKEMIERSIERIERAEEAAEERAAETEAARGDTSASGAPAQPPPTGWRAWANHPYAVQIVGGVVAGVFLLVIAALLFS